MRRVVILASLLACNGGNGDQDTGVVDTGFVDTGGGDSGGGDTGETGDTSVTLEVGDPTADVVVETCEGTLDAPVAGELCTVSGDPQTATHILIKGRVLGVDTIYEGGGVLVEQGDNGVMECVGCDCDSEAPSTTLVVSCPDG